MYSLIEGNFSQENINLICDTLDHNYLIEILTIKYEDCKKNIKIEADDNEIEDIIEKMGP